MAGRPTKQGIDYFPVDVGFFEDIKIRKISRSCGPNSTSILICLLCNIYKNDGYYILWDEDMPFVIADLIGVSEGAVKEVILKAIQVDFFSKEKYEQHKILTSAGIQKRFFLAIYQRKETDIIKEYVINCTNNSINHAINSIDCNGNEQSKVKVKVKRKKKDNNPPPPPSGKGVKKKNSSRLNVDSRSLFEEHFKSLFSEEYYWTAKDSGNMTSLLNALKFQREQKGLENTDDQVLVALKAFLGSITDKWILEHYSLANINSKFNELISQARNANNRKNDQGGAGKSSGIKSHRF